MDPDWKQPVGHRLGIAFLCDDPAGVDSTFKTLTDAGRSGYRAPWDAFWGQRYAQVEDCDGN